MRTLFLSAFLLLVLAASVSAGWVERLEVHALDQNGKPASDVNVEIRYQKNDYTSTNDGRIVGSTALNGIFKADIVNSVSEDKNVQEYYTVRVWSSYWAGETRKVRYGDNLIGENNAHHEDFSVPFALRGLNVTVSDYWGTPVSGAVVKVVYPDSAERETNTEGVAIFRVRQGYDAEASAYFSEGASASSRSTGNMTQDTEIKIINPNFFNNLTVIAYDENGTMLENCFVSAGEKVNYTNASGEAMLFGINNLTANVSAECREVELTLQHVFRNASDALPFNFTNRPFSIEDVNVWEARENGTCANITVEAFITDVRIGDSSEINASLNYSFEGSAEQSEAMKIAENENALFQAVIPCSFIVENSTFRYRVYAVDRYGELLSTRTNYRIAEKKIEESIITPGTEENESEIENKTMHVKMGGTEEQGMMGMFGPITIVLVLLVGLCIVFVGLFLYKNEEEYSVFSVIDKIKNRLRGVKGDD
ncbi:MAG: hypothetical protein ABIH99_02190 [Candidatus Micrarchaeota archaeon]